MAKVVILKFRFIKTKKTDIIGVFSNALEAQKYIDSHKETEHFKHGEWALSDRELIS